MGNTKNKSNLFLNTFIPLLCQLATIVCGFILPRIILKNFGSDVNGLCNSISNFIGFINLFESGVSNVFRYSLYKPLVEHDEDQISRVMISSKRFFNKIAFGLCGYIVILCIFYPKLIENSSDFPFWYVAILIVVLSIDLLAQFFVGQSNKIILNADKKKYILSGVSIISVISNTVLCIVLVKLGAGIHVVKLVSSLVFLLSPIVGYFYVKKHYNINYKLKLDKDPVEHKMAAFYHHFSGYIMDSTDVMVLTIFSDLKNVSIYSVYYMVVKHLKTLVTNSVDGSQTELGHLIAKDDTNGTRRFFNRFEWTVHTIGVYLYGCAAALIVPFVTVYTRDLEDKELYMVPAFAILITLAVFGYMLRLPYSTTILAAGKFEETKWCYIIGAVMNLVVSIALVTQFGLIGVAIGTLVALLFQTVWLAIVSYREVLKTGMMQFVKRIIVDAIIFALIYLSTFTYKPVVTNYFNWLIYAIFIAACAVVIVLVINLIFYRNYLFGFIKHAYKKIKKKLFKKKAK